ncbi:MAG: hypothetical protein AAFN17_00210 [Pseudomonadota bacterium]
MPMNVFKLLMTSAAMMAAAIVVEAPAPASAAEPQYAQLPQGDPKRKLMILHWQEVLLERIVKGACFVSAGVEVDRNRAIVTAARDRFERTLPDIEAEIRAMDPANPTVKRLNRSIDKKRKQWFRFRVALDQAIKDEGNKDAVDQVALMEIGLMKYVDQVYKALRRDLMKKGDVNLEDVLQEVSAFQRVFLSDVMVREACLVSIGIGGQTERLKLLEAVESFEKQLATDEVSPAAPGAVKDMVPAWRSIMPEIRALTNGDQPPVDLLRRLEELKHNWSEASGEPALGLAVG